MRIEIDQMGNQISSLGPKLHLFGQIIACQHVKRSHKNVCCNMFQSEDLKPNSKP